MKKNDLILSDLEKYDIYDLAELIGIDLCKQVIDNFEGSLIYVPMWKQLQRANRNELVINDHSQGLTVKMLAIKYSITCARVYQILKEEEKL